MTDIRKFRTYMRMAREFKLSEQKIAALIDLLNDPQFDDTWMSDMAKKMLELFGYSEENAQELSDIYEFEELELKELEKVEAN